MRIVDYTPAHRPHFKALNLEWITAHFAVEEADRRVLDDPEGHVLAEGGHILMAEDATGDVVGTCALLRITDGSFELAKMAVAPRARGRGVGRALGEAAVERARALGAARVELLSNRVLAPALALYKSLGFVEVPLPATTEYRRADIKMELDLRDRRTGG